MLFYLLIGFIVFQRLLELIYASKNKKKIMNLGGEEFDENGFKVIVLMHSLFILSLVLEYNLSGSYNRYSIHFFCIFIFAQILRYWAILSLGMFWNTRIIILKNSELIKKGPYKYFRHPNYLAVAIEFLSIPLIFSLYFTCVLFFFSNLIILYRRIHLEEKALGLR